MGKTSIEWTRGDDGSPGRTWNPVTGCDKVSPGCDHCYAEGIARRFAGSKAFPNGFDVTLHWDRVESPLRWRKPARVFVNSMSDLFHQGIPDDFIARVFAVMAATPQHTYQILTKRHGRMRSLLNNPRFREDVMDEAFTSLDLSQDWADNTIDRDWPLSNVWMGVSVEDQQRADLRIPALLDTNAAVRFLSCEPLLGPVSLWEHLSNPSSPRRLAGDALPHLDWVIIGGESGPGARRMELDWAEQLVEQCKTAGVAPFVKQLGSAHGPHKGGAFDTWPAELQVREYPTAAVPA
jgi:protein gp37